MYSFRVLNCCFGQHSFGPERAWKLFKQRPFKKRLIINVTLSVTLNKIPFSAEFIYVHRQGFVEMIELLNIVT